MGVLTSSAHQAWALAEGSTIEDRPRYTKDSCFETFPWPDAADATRDRIALRAVELLDRRAKVCQEHRIGLTELYNLVDEGAFREVAEAHNQLDVAVMAGYGWSSSLSNDHVELRAKLADLHDQIVGGKVTYTPFRELGLRSPGSPAA